MNHNRAPNPQEQRNLIVAFALSMIILVGFYVFYERPQTQALQAQKTTDLAAIQAEAPSTPAATTNNNVQTIATALNENTRIAVDTPSLKGSINLTGLRFDDLQLKKYSRTLKNNIAVRLLAPATTNRAYFVDNGYMTADTSIETPNSQTLWELSSESAKTLTPETAVTLSWQNPQKIIFERKISVDKDYAFTIEDTIKNNSNQSITLYPFARVQQTRNLEATKNDIDDKTAFNGALGYFNDELEEARFDDLADDGKQNFEQTNGWVGMTNKYWFVSIIPNPTYKFDASFVHQSSTNGNATFQADWRGQPLVVGPQNAEKFSQYVFAGPKELNLLNAYEKTLSVPHLDLAIDFGMLYFITKPFYWLLTTMGNLFSSMGMAVSFGLALLCLTVIVRIITFPLTYKAFVSMNKMKDLAPKLKDLKAKHGDDKVKFQQEIMKLYQTEKVTPASGCLPMLLQIPIFLALYRVFSIAIEMRHAPFWGWIHDLSAADPSSMLNLFGLIPFELPSFLVIGAWPLLYGLSMWAQQKFYPPAEDPIQRQMMAMFPWIFTYVFAHFPAGLVIYFTWSNLLGWAQNTYIKWHMHRPKKSKV